MEPLNDRPLNQLSAKIRTNSQEKGFWDEERNFGEMMMLIVSEVAEALESHRNKEPMVWISNESKLEGVATELVDVLIRTLDTLSMYEELDIDELVEMKMAYNATRGRMHGKAY